MIVNTNDLFNGHTHVLFIVILLLFVIWIFNIKKNPWMTRFPTPFVGKD